MPMGNTNDAPVTLGTRRHRRLWDGVLPEALGLCFVAIIFGGFTSAYLIADYAWGRQAGTAQQVETETLAQAMATAVGAVAGSDEQVVDSLMQKLVRLPRVRAVRWTSSEGELRFAWPRTLAAVPGNTPAAPGVSAARTSQATAARVVVRTPAGESAGTLTVERAASGSGDYQAAMLWNWGIAAGVTLVVFAALYHRLRHHLRPVAAIERNLRSLAGGVEEDLATLMLSDSLGTVAHGWNRLITQLAELQRQVQHASEAGGSRDVLARFESAVFRRVVDRLPFGVLWVGEAHTISYANAAGAALLGCSTEELVGQPASAAIDNPAVMQAVLAAQTNRGGAPAVDHTRKDGDQETTLRFRVLALSSQPTGGDVLVTVEDIGQLRESQRARDNFLYHVTHELRTPLTNIHAYAETLTKPDFDDEQTRKECYNVIVSETRRLSRLVEDILSISQLEVGTARMEVGEVDLVRLLRQMVQDNLGSADEKHIDLTLALPPKVPKIRGDKQRLSVLLNNLIGNAVKYTRGSGKVHVQLEMTEQRVRITVRDTGIGIRPEDLPHVFEKFYRAAAEEIQAVPGTGLGLAIAQEVARLHGGEIHVESEPGKGSAFTVDLPLVTSDCAEVPVR